MRTVYIAADGKEFDNEFECEHYEWMLNHPNLKYIKIYDNRTGELFDDITTDDAYNYGDKVVVPTELAVNDLQDWATYSGYCYFHQITEVGTWLFNEDKNVYEKVSEDMNNILASKVLMSHLPKITDGAYKKATEIAIETLFLDAMDDWRNSDCELSAREYLGLTEEQYKYWLLGKNKRRDIDT